MSDKTIKRKQLNIADKIAITVEVNSAAKKADVYRIQFTTLIALYTIKEQEELIKCLPYITKQE